jgi:hypothetical protein
LTTAARFHELVHTEACNDDNPHSTRESRSYRKIADEVGEDQDQSGVQRVVVCFPQALAGA